MDMINSARRTKQKSTRRERKGKDIPQSVKKPENRKVWKKVARDSCFPCRALCLCFIYFRRVRCDDDEESEEEDEVPKAKKPCVQVKKNRFLVTHFHLF